MELLEGYMVDLFHISKTVMLWIFRVNGRKEKKEDLPQSSGSCRIVVPGRQKKTGIQWRRVCRGCCKINC